MLTIRQVQQGAEVLDENNLADGVALLRQTMITEPRQLSTF